MYRFIEREFISNTMIIKTSVFKRGILLYAFIVIAAIIMNMLAFMVPQSPVHQNIIWSAYSFREEGPFPQVIKGYDFTIPDNNTDAWMLLIADYDNSEDTLLEKALEGKYYHYPVQNNGLIGTDNIVAVEEGNIEGIWSYSRYWHGWLLPLRLLLTVFDYSEIRFFNIIILGLLLMGVIVGLEQNGMRKLILPFTVVWIAMVPVTIPLCMAYMISVLIALTAMLLLLYQRDKINTKLTTPLLFLAIGMVTAFSEFLQYPLITLGWPVVLNEMLLQKDGKALKERFRQLVLCSVLWGFGYIGMWMSKWVITDLLTDMKTIKEAFHQISIRLSSTSNFEMTDHISRSQTIMENMRRLNQAPFVMLLCGVIIIYIVLFLLGKKRKQTLSKTLDKASLLLLVCVYPFAWWIVFANHSWIHSHFTYRIITITIFAFLSILATICERERC